MGLVALEHVLLGVFFLFLFSPVRNSKDNSCGREQAPVETIDVEVLIDKLCRTLCLCFLLKRMRKCAQESLYLNHIHV